MSDKLIEEIKSFQTIWKGGFRTGYTQKRNQKGIEEYLEKNMTGKCCLEIGCGGGQWSKFIYNLNVFDKIYCIDVLLDYVFSYDVFCHISYSGQKKYLENLYKKCKINCKLFIMYADPKKYLSSEPEHLNHVKTYIPNRGIDCNTNEELIEKCLLDKDGIPSVGRWYWVGIENFINLCTKYNYKILDNDLNIDKTNPITLFTK